MERCVVSFSFDLQVLMCVPAQVLDGKQTIADIDVEDDDLIDVEW